MICPPQVRAITNRISLIHKVSAQRVNELAINTALVFFLSYENFFDFEDTIEWSPSPSLVPQSYIPYRELDIAEYWVFILRNRGTVIES